MAIKLPPFRGQHDRWHQWRYRALAVFGGYDLIGAITTPRPPDAPVAPAPGGAGGGAGGAGGGAGGNAGGDAGGGGGGAGAGGGVIAPVAPAGPPVRTPAQVWDLKNERVFMYLLMCTEGDANATVSQFCGTRHGADAWQALLDKYDPQGQLGITLTSSQLTNLRYKPGTDPDLMFMEAERLNARLTALGQPFPEQALIGMLLSKLPREIFGYFDSSPGSQCRCDLCPIQDHGSNWLAKVPG